jgi:hypothetical protein
VTALGIVSFSFGLRRPDEEPGPCNARLASATRRVLGETGPAVLVSQWEVARALPAGLPAHVVEQPAGGPYLDTERVWSAAAPLLRDAGVTRVVAVAQPLLHRAKAHRLVRRDGFEPVRARVGWIGFDSSVRNTQWWTRGPLRLLLYALLQSSTGRAGR